MQIIEHSYPPATAATATQAAVPRRRPLRRSRGLMHSCAMVMISHPSTSQRCWRNIPLQCRSLTFDLGVPELLTAADFTNPVLSNSHFVQTRHSFDKGCWPVQTSHVPSDLYSKSRNLSIGPLLQACHSYATAVADSYLKSHQHAFASRTTCMACSCRPIS